MTRAKHMILQLFQYKQEVDRLTDLFSQLSTWFSLLLRLKVVRDSQDFTRLNFYCESRLFYLVEAEKARVLLHWQQQWAPKQLIEIQPSFVLLFLTEVRVLLWWKKLFVWSWQESVGDVSRIFSSDTCVDYTVQCVRDLKLNKVMWKSPVRCCRQPPSTRICSLWVRR